MSSRLGDLFLSFSCFYRLQFFALATFACHHNPAALSDSDAPVMLISPPMEHAHYYSVPHACLSELIFSLLFDRGDQDDL